MKKGWQTKTLGEICDIERGGSPRPIQEFITADPNGINWIKISDATASGKYIYKTEEKIKPDGVKRSRMVYDGDFILSNSMSFGRPYIMKTTGCIHDGWLVLHKPKVHPDYLYHALSSDLVFDQFDRLAAGSTVRNLNIGLAKSVQIPVPPLAEQQRIVGLLDEAFEGLATAKANYEANLQNAHALFESHLQSVFTQRGPGWEEKTLGDVCDATQGVQLSKSEQSPTKLPGYRRYLYISDFESDKNLKYVRDEHPKKLVTPDDIIVANTGSAGKIFRGIDGILSNNLFKVSFDASTVDRDFIFFFVTSGLFREYQQSIMRGTANPHMGHMNFKSTPICIPGIEVQKIVVEQIHEFAEETQRLARLYERKHALLSALKKSLLHQAFTGAL